MIIYLGSKHGLQFALLVNHAHSPFWLWGTYKEAFVVAVWHHELYDGTNGIGMMKTSNEWSSDICIFLSLDSTSLRERRQSRCGRRVWSSLLFRTVLTRISMSSARPPRLVLEANTIRKQKNAYLIFTSCVWILSKSKLCSSRPVRFVLDNSSNRRSCNIHDFTVIIYNKTPPPLLKKQEYLQIPYLHFYSSCPLVDYAIQSWARKQYLSMPHTFELKLRRYSSALCVGQPGRKAYNLSRMRRPLTWSILPFIFSSRIRETTSPSASALVTLRDWYQLLTCLSHAKLTFAKNWSSRRVYGLMRSMMYCVRSERRRSLMK
jgi:hypothetical protein